MDILIFLKVIGNLLFFVILVTALTLTTFFYSLSFLLEKGLKNRQLIPSKWMARRDHATQRF